MTLYWSFSQSVGKFYLIDSFNPAIPPIVMQHLASSHKLRRTVPPCCLSFSTLLSSSVDPKWQDKRTDLGVWQELRRRWRIPESLPLTNVQRFMSAPPLIFSGQRLTLVEVRLLHLNPGSCNCVRFGSVKKVQRRNRTLKSMPERTDRGWKPGV